MNPPAGNNMGPQQNVFQSLQPSPQVGSSPYNNYQQNNYAAPPYQPQQPQCNMTNYAPTNNNNAMNNNQNFNIVVNAPAATVIGESDANKLPEPGCCDVFCMAVTPQYPTKCMTKVCGFFECWSSSGLECGACCGCYGCSRPSCCSVCCAGYWLNIAYCIVYGFVASIVIGIKMMCI